MRNTMPFKITFRPHWWIICLYFGVQISTFHTTQAQEEVVKTISETYKVTKKHRLEITNRHGKVDIHTKSAPAGEISVKVEIRVSGRTEERAQEILNEIQIEYGQNDDEIYFETEAENIGLNRGKNRIEINYTVYMPSENQLDIENKYGNVFIDDFEGNLDVEVRYGKLRANKLTKKEKDIILAYGGLDIEELEQGDLEVSYSGGEIGKAGIIDLENKYGSIKFGSVKELEVETKYGGLKIENEATRIMGEMGYSKFSVGKLLKSLEMDVRYAGGFEVQEVAPNFENIHLEGSYTTFNLEFASNANFDFHITTRYGGFRNSIEDRTKLQRDISEGQSSEYEGKIGQGGGSVRINTRYGSVRFQ